MKYENDIFNIILDFNVIVESTVDPDDNFPEKLLSMNKVITENCN